MDTWTPSQRRLHRFAVFTACCTFLLVIAGGLVTSTGSGLSVPDWPLSYGKLMPPMVGGILYEHGHRMVATFVGMLMIVLAYWLWKAEERRWVRILGLAGLAAVIVQGVLGGLTVLFLLPTPISVLHATLAQSFFGLTVIIALVTSPGWKRVVPREMPVADKTRRLALSVSGILLVQLILGAWMRHSDAGLAIPDFPLSYGQMLPPATDAGISAVNQDRLAGGLPPVELSQVWINFAHRLGALLTAIVVLSFVLHVLKAYQDEKRLREPAIVLGVLLVMQILFGALTVWTGKGVEIATVHVAVGSLLLATSACITLRTFRLFTLSQTEPEVSTLAQLSRS